MNHSKSCFFLFVFLFGFSLNLYSYIEQAPAVSSYSGLSPANFKGAPSITHYNRSDFNADPQFWAMCEDDEGVMYFGNNDGALVFDGETWQKVFLPNGSSVRSMLYADDGEVYVGGFNEFGKVKKDVYGTYYFESMLSILENENHNLETVWDIQQVNNVILFRTFKTLIAVENQKAILFPADLAFTFSEVIQDKLYVEDNGLIKHLDLENARYQTVFGKNQIKNEDMVAIVPYRAGQLLVVTKQGSLFILFEEDGSITWKSDVISKNSNNLVTCVLKSRDGLYYLGTLSTKTLVLDTNAERLETSRTFELQDQTVLNLFESKEGNVWALLNNGLDFIDLASPVTHVFDEASVYDVQVAHGKVFVASNQGVYLSNLSSGSSPYSGMKFTKIKGMEGQAWTIDVYQEQVVTSHDKGIYVFDPDGSIYQVEGVSGIWKVIPLHGKPGQYLACGYDGLYLLTFNNNTGRLELVQKIDGFTESSRDILQSEDPHVFWICHGYKGVYRIRLNEDFMRVTGVEHFRDQNGLPSPYSVNVFKYQGNTVFTTNHGIFTYDESGKVFSPFQPLNSLFGSEKNVRSLQVVDDKLWFVHDDEAGYVDFINGVPKQEWNKDLFMVLKGEFNRSMETILPIDKSMVLMGTRQGLYSFDLTYEGEGDRHNLVFRKIRYTRGQEEIQAATAYGTDETLEIPNDATGISFGYAVPGFKNRQVEYSFLLEGASQDWSPWNTRSTVDFSYLKPGDYKFVVKARSRIGETSELNAFSFKVLPKWYQTNWALLFFVLLAGGLMILVVIAVQKKIKTEKEKARTDQAEKTKLLELELQQMKLENEKRRIEKDKEMLEEDVVYKSKELANYTMLLIKKKDLLNELHEELQQVRDSTTGEKINNRLRALQRMIQSNLSDEEHLQVFDANFERVHQIFFNELKTAFPNLSTRELRLCAFVKMNLTNKEIASMLNISVRGVETARYRLRKRLSLDHDVNMVEFLDSLSAAEMEGGERNQ